MIMMAVTVQMVMNMTSLLLMTIKPKASANKGITRISSTARESGVTSSSPALADSTEEQLLTWVLGQSQITDLPKDAWPVFPETWHHLCHVLGQTSYRVYWQGEVP